MGLHHQRPYRSSISSCNKQQLCTIPPCPSSISSNTAFFRKFPVHTKTKYFIDNGVNAVDFLEIWKGFYQYVQVHWSALEESLTSLQKCKAFFGQINCQCRCFVWCHVSSYYKSGQQSDFANVSGIGGVL